MKLLLVTEREETHAALLRHLRPVGFEIICYLQPLKAMDNIDEIDPEVIAFSSVDFPRHWKPFVKLLRERKTREECVFVLLADDDLPFEEAAKAVHIGVNAILPNSIEEPRALQNIQDILVRYGMIRDGRDTRRYVPREYDELELILALPQTMQLVTGSLSDISETGACFVPDISGLTAALEPGIELPYCSLKVGDRIFSVGSRVLRIGDSLALQFFDLAREDWMTLRTYLNDRARRALERLKSTSAPS